MIHNKHVKMKVEHDTNTQCQGHGFESQETGPIKFIRCTVH